MPNSTSNDFYDVEYVKELNPIEEVIGNDIKLKRAGRDKLIGLCLFHDDRKPSLVVYIENQNFYCYGCRAHGDVIDYIRLRDGLSFQEALTYLAKRVNIPPSKISLATAHFTEENRIIQDILTDTAIYYHNELLNNLELKTKLMEDRKFTEETLIKYIVGVAISKKSELSKYLLGKGYKRDHLLKSGVCELKNEEVVDYFRNRFIFPITKAGKVVYLAGRSIEDTLPKWKHLKGGLSYLFNESALKRDEVFLTEGIPDCITLLQEEFNAAGVLGANSFNESYISKFKQVSELYICFDNDRNQSGQKASQRIGSMLTKNGIRVRIVNIPRPEGKESIDVNDFFLEHSRKDFEKLVKKAIDITKEGALKVISDKLGVTEFMSPFGHSYVISGITDTDRGIKVTIELFKSEETLYRDSIIISSGHSRTKFANKCQELSQKKIEAFLLEKELLTIESYIRNMITDRLNKSRKKEKEEPYSMTDEEKQEALEFLKNPNIMHRIVADMDTLGYIGEEINKQMAYLITTSRKLDKPLSGVVKAQSASGKSALVKTVIKLMPPEECLDLSRVTEQALFYMDNDALSHKFIVIMEHEGSEPANYSIRQLQSEQQLTLLVPIKNPKTGGFKTVPLEVKGPIGYMETTTQSQIDNENATRMLDLCINESEEQTQLVHRAQRESRLLEGLLNTGEKEKIIRTHQNAQRLLKNYRIVIPYADKLSFPITPIRSRRDNERFLNLIEAITFLRQYQKEVKVFETTGEEYIEADVEDYEIAYNLAITIFSQTLDEISKESRELLKLIKDMVTEKYNKQNRDEWLSPKDVKFTRKDVRNYTKWKDYAVHQCMKELENIEYLEVVQGGMGKTYIYKFAYEGDPEIPKIKDLLTPEKLQAKIDGD